MSDFQYGLPSPPPSPKAAAVEPLMPKYSSLFLADGKTQDSLDRFTEKYFGRFLPSNIHAGDLVIDLAPGDCIARMEEMGFVDMCNNTPCSTWTPQPRACTNLDDRKEELGTLEIDPDDAPALIRCGANPSTFDSDFLQAVHKALKNGGWCLFEFVEPTSPSRVGGARSMVDNEFEASTLRSSYFTGSADVNAIRKMLSDFGFKEVCVRQKTLAKEEGREFHRANLYWAKFRASLTSVKQKTQSVELAPRSYQLYRITAQKPPEADSNSLGHVWEVRRPQSQPKVALGFLNEM
ncbi:hypothetical protein PWT90_07463 [Aphanocladium album]|nr:hypothetical protein PWT90_07463 [Aphanocladium album]